jgi:hypothetical protein
VIPEFEASVETWEPPELSPGRDGERAVLSPRPQAFQGDTYALEIPKRWENKVCYGGGYVVHLYWILFDQILAASVRLSPQVAALREAIDGNALKYAHERFDNAYTHMVEYMEVIMRAAKTGVAAPPPPPGIAVIDDGADFPEPHTFDHPSWTWKPKEVDATPYRRPEGEPRAINVSIIDDNQAFPEAR